MKTILLTVCLSVLLILNSYSQSYYFGIKPNIGFIYQPSEDSEFNIQWSSSKALNLEYALLWTNRSYYNSVYNGFSTGITYTSQNIENIKTGLHYPVKFLQLPVLYTLKVQEWNDYLKVGIVYKRTIDDPKYLIRKNDLFDAYLNIGFDNEFSIRSPFRYNTSLYMQYNLTPSILGSDNNQIRLLEIGFQFGILYNIDYYHYKNRGNYNGIWNQ